MLAVSRTFLVNSPNIASEMTSSTTRIAMAATSRMAMPAITFAEPVSGEFPAGLLSCCCVICCVPGFVQAAGGSAGCAAVTGMPAVSLHGRVIIAAGSPVYTRRGLLDTGLTGTLH